MMDDEIEEEMDDDPTLWVSYFVYAVSILCLFMAIWYVTPWFPWA